MIQHNPASDSTVCISYYRIWTLVQNYEWKCSCVEWRCSLIVLYFLFAKPKTLETHIFVVICTIRASNLSVFATPYSYTFLIPILFSCKVLTRNLPNSQNFINSKYIQNVESACATDIDAKFWNIILFNTKVITKKVFNTKVI